MPQWIFARDSLRAEGWDAVVAPRPQLWHSALLRVGSLAKGDLGLAAVGLERVVVPLEGDVTIDWTNDDAHGTIDLRGRASVFAGACDAASFDAHTSIVLRGPGRVAVAEAPASRRAPPAIARRENAPIELRGRGASSREVRNLGTPGVLDAESLIVCEVITPAGNWSSYPPHKHDSERPGEESQLEEVYYFEAVVAAGGADGSPTDPFGMFAAYSSPAGDIDLAGLVRTGDIALVPYGYHGPAAAPPGYDLYYLNVMAGPTRVWLAADDPRHTWIRATWADQNVDSRLPLGGIESTEDR